MDLKQLQYFIAIAEEGSVTAAANRLHMTQPPLSQQLKKLEDELEVTLFDRNSRKLQLTEVGEIFLIRARQILSFSRAAQKEITDFSNGYMGTVIIGITPTAVPLVLSSEIARFHQKYPLINFEFFEGNTFVVNDLLKKGIVNIAILRSPFHCEGLNVIKKEEEPMVAAMMSEYNWSSSSTCSIRDLDKRNIILYHRYEALLAESFADYNILPRIICKCDYSSTALQAAEAGLGIALLPASALKMASSELIFKNIEEPLLYTRPMAVWLSDQYLPKSASVFLDYFENL